uniref:alkaline phosphatase n=1 Tax=Timema tahoe TaxID=61484 RepID=A0A7R9NY00_9NEOP|nr:unnamed protein product [Timema tahoe]
MIAGMATGIVTNARLTHATPAALYAHAPNRYWEDDSKVPVESRRTCKDIARQLIEDSPGKDINVMLHVILGGGRRHWEREGRRLDGRNLVDDWLRDKRRRGLLAHYVETAEELSQLNTRHLDYLLGLINDQKSDVIVGIFAPSHMSFELDRKLSPGDEPSLSEMVTTAIRLLRRNSRGFLLVVEGTDTLTLAKATARLATWSPRPGRCDQVAVVYYIDSYEGGHAWRPATATDFKTLSSQAWPVTTKSIPRDLVAASWSRRPGRKPGRSLSHKRPPKKGGRIDHASHYNNAYRVLDETLSLESAVLVALSEVDAAETLVVVTSDHSNMLTLGGLSTTRGNAIFGLKIKNKVNSNHTCPVFPGYDSVMSDVDGRPYSTLQFANGPKFSPGRVSARNSAVPLKWATHGGEDVPVFTRGPMADLLFTGTFDQSYIPHAIAFAACLGEHKKRCSVHAKNYTLLDC